MEQITPETAALSVLAPSGDAVRLDSLWAERPALLVLVRHFGCQFCREQLADLRDTFPQVEAAGVQPAVIGNGTPLMAQAFLQETGVEAPLYTDPPREVYRALGTKRPSARVFLQPRQWWYFIRAAARGYFPKAKPQGDPAQLGGVFLVRPDGSMPYAHRSDLAGDHPSTAEVMRAVRDLARSSQD